MEPTQRLFIAAPLPDSLKQRIADWQNEARTACEFRTWVHPSDLHITLKFLGDTALTQVNSIRGALQQTVAAGSPLRLRLGSLGTFGRANAPSVLWSGIQGDLAALKGLQRRVEAAVQAIGIPQEERAYKPHLTLARAYTGHHDWDRSKLQRCQWPHTAFPEWQIDRIVLYRSRLGLRPMYEPMDGFSLIEADSSKTEGMHKVSEDMMS